MEERNAERQAFSPRRLKALITAVPGSYRAAWMLAAFGAGTGRQPLTVRPFVRSSRTGNSGIIIAIRGKCVNNSLALWRCFGLSHRKMRKIECRFCHPAQGERGRNVYIIAF